MIRCVGKFNGRNEDKKGQRKQSENLAQKRERKKLMSCYCIAERVHIRGCENQIEAKYLVFVPHRAEGKYDSTRIWEAVVHRMPEAQNWSFRS